MSGPAHVQVYIPWPPASGGSPRKAGMGPARNLWSQGGARMKKLNYAGVVDPWKVDLIVKRAKCMGFRSHELEDVQQELILDVMRFRFDPARANGAKEATALVALIDNRLRNLVRSCVRYLAHRNRFGREVEEAYEPIAVLERALDVTSVVASLPERERQVCRGLGLGETRSAIASRLGLGWHTVNRIIGRIRQRFQETGLEAWVGPGRGV